MTKSSPKKERQTGFQVLADGVNDASLLVDRYRKLMKLVHPDSLVTLKGAEPTTILTLVMAASLLRSTPLPFVGLWLKAMVRG